MKAKVLKTLCAMLACVLIVGLSACGKQAVEEISQTDMEEIEPIESETVEVKKEYSFADVKDLVDGIEDIKVWNASATVEDTEAADHSKLDQALLALISVDENVINDVSVDSTHVDISKAGTYEVIYTISVCGESMETILTDDYKAVLKPLTETKDADNEVIIEVSLECQIMNDEEVAKAIEDGATNIIGAVVEGTNTESFDASVAKMEEAKVKAEVTPEPAKPAHEHNWVPVTVYHEETGHFEKTYETRTVIKCKCGQIFYDSASCEAHSFPLKEDGCAKSGSIEEMQVETGSTWVVDQPAWDEVIGYNCECGATKDAK